MKRRITAVSAAIIMACSCASLTAQGAEDDLHITVDRRILQPSEVIPGAEVPVYVRLNAPHKPLTSLEFGITVDARCTCRNITANKEAKSVGGEGLDMVLITSQYENDSWNVWASGTEDMDSETLMLVAVTLPEDAGYGDCYTVEYIADHAGVVHCWKTAYDGVVVYSELGQVSWESGYILIAPDKGDVNLDRSVDILDVIALNRYLLGSRRLDTAAQYAAETDGNELIDSTDSLRVLKHVVGMIDLSEE